MATMISTSFHTYGTKALKPGDEFEAESTEHVLLLIKLDRAKRKEGTFSRKYKRRDMTAEGKD